MIESLVTLLVFTLTLWFIGWILFGLCTLLLDFAHVVVTIGVDLYRSARRWAARKDRT